MEAAAEEKTEAPINYHICPNCKKKEEKKGLGLFFMHHSKQNANNPGSAASLVV